MANEPDNEGDEQESRREDELYRLFRPAFDVSRMFPDYSKMLESIKPDYSKLLRAAMPDYSSMLANMVIPDYSRMFRAAAISPDLAKLVAPNLSELLPKLDVRTLFPDYSRTFPRVDTAALFRSYREALPDAAHAAEEYVLEEVASEAVALEDGQAEEIRPADAMDWIRELPPSKQRELTVKLGTTIGALLAFAKAALDANIPFVAGAVLALATALYSIYAFVVAESERRAEESGD